ncbi:G5 domain-containing protein [Paenibacillus sp. KN14-4R]|uniref:G5 domain-containing protein n=1 Tax=Paenibacillus sp. KN14-4R TaxID=3445773 RepID=UPI003FA059B4
MGNISDLETHVKRSSSMSFVMRWKRENLRLISIISITSIAMTFMFLVLLYGTATKSVSVVVNGQETIVKTKQWVLKRLLDEQAIRVGEHDRISLALDSTIKQGQKIIIDYASPIQITADGDTATVYTAAKTVGEVLNDSHIKLGELDRAIPALEQPVAAGTDIKIIRVRKETEKITETIPFETVKQDEAKLAKGKEQVVQQGKEGTKVKQMEKVYENGVLISSNVLEELVQTPSVEKVIAVGTKKEVSTLSASSTDGLAKGKNFAAKQILNNVSLTAYSAGDGGKAKGTPNYGMTATGTRAVEGRTIAVDPNVVPLGWWVYIEGIGYRRAEDTGSAVKGMVMDVYYDSADYVNRFGRKRGYTVYVIGPKKPETE